MRRRGHSLAVVLFSSAAVGVLVALLVGAILLALQVTLPAFA